MLFPMTSKARWWSPSIPVPPMYIPGRCRTESRDSVMNGSARDGMPFCTTQRHRLRARRRSSITPSTASASKPAVPEQVHPDGIPVPPPPVAPPPDATPPPNEVPPPNAVPPALPPPSALPPPAATQVPRAGLPVKLKIPKIKVDANIEYVGLAADGAMDVPKNYDNTAWYQLGPRPGEQGNAAIAGHVDSKTGKAVFWDQSKLKPGDEIFVDGEDGVERKFVVKEIASYKRADAPLDRIFGASTQKSLNLITCDPTSTFNRTTNEYAANVVVYTELADGQ